MKEQQVIKKYCVYMHTSPNDKRYIGITSMEPPESRWRNGDGYSHNAYFSNAIQKYGWDNFAHDIIADNLSEEDAMQMERELISKYNTINPTYGYNQTSGGEVGKRCSDELRERLSEIITERMRDPALRNRLSEIAKQREMFGENNPNYGNHKLAGENNPNYGKHHSEETRQKMRDAKANISEETRKKLSEAAKKNMTEDRRLQIAEMNKNRQVSEDTRRKMSESHKHLWTDELRSEHSLRFSGENNPMHGKHHSEETKQILREMFSGEKSYRYGTHVSEETRFKMIETSPLKEPVVQLTLDGGFIGEYPSIGEASRNMGIDRHLINKCCSTNCQSKSAGGYLWVYKRNYVPGAHGYKNERFRSVVKLTNEFILIDEYISIAEASRDSGSARQNIGECCRKNAKFDGKMYMCGGYAWMYLDDYEQYKINNNKEI